MSGGPEDRVLESIWDQESPEHPLVLKAGEVHVSMMDPVVWLPFLVLLVTGWVGIAALLPPGLGAQFISLTLGWLGIVSGEFTAGLVSLIGNLAGLVVAFYVYTWIYRWIVTIAVGRLP